MLRSVLAFSLLQPVVGDNDAAQCNQWAQKGECAKNPQFMLTGCADACKRHEESRRDKSPECPKWAASGDCDASASVQFKCPTSCEKALEDQLPPTSCAALHDNGGCHTEEGLGKCRSSCLAHLSRNQTSDTEGNCWYWGTDGECHPSGNSVWMKQTCPRSCDKLWACRSNARH